ncbi:MAG: hypothetical protein ACLP9S_05760 [Syntrophales bacterium]
MVGQEEVYIAENEVLKSGIFRLDQYGFPIGIYKLTANKALSKRDILDVHVQELQKFLHRLEYLYSLYITEKTENPDRLKREAINTEQRSFQQRLYELIETYALDKSALEPQLKSFLKKINKRIEVGIKKNKRLTRIIQGRRREWRYAFLITMLDHQLRKLRLKGDKELTKEDRFYYISHFLIGTSIEKQEEPNGYKKLFNRLWRYDYRDSHRRKNIVTTSNIPAFRSNHP